MTRFSPPEHVRSVLTRLESGGYPAYLVGGCVRDTLLGRAVHDWDIATGARAAEISALFDKTVMTGARYGTVTVVLHGGSVEVTTFRADGDYNDSRHPESVRFVDSVHDDLGRRDFTVNAIAVTLSGGIIDPFGGRADIESRTIRCVGDPEVRFREDALRMFRALRFSAQLGFTIEPFTHAAITQCAALAGNLSAERVSSEVEKTLLSPRPEIAGDILAAGLLREYVEPSALRSDDFAAIAGLPIEKDIRWAAFCAVLIHAGVIKSTAAFLYGMRMDAKTVKSCDAGTALANNLAHTHTELKHTIAQHGLPAARCAAAADFALRGGIVLDIICGIINSGECCSLFDLAVSGRDLIAAGHLSGKTLGDTLDALLAHVIEHPGDNNRETLLALAANYI